MFIYPRLPEFRIKGLGLRVVFIKRNPCISSMPVGFHIFWQIIGYRLRRHVTKMFHKIKLQECDSPATQETKPWCLLSYTSLDLRPSYLDCMGL